MLTLITATMLSMAAMKADPQENARKAFSNCLVELHNSGIDAKQSPGDFNKASETSCMEQRKAYHDIIIKNERSFGSSAKDAEEYASGEVQSILDGVVASYNENLQVSSKMQTEK